jgi:hypothetical protein
MSDTTENFDKIATWIEPTPLTFTAQGYKADEVNDDGKFRRLCPHVLGYKKGGETDQEDERVLCWQLEGPGHDDPAKPEWRCYKVKFLVDIDVDMLTPWKMGTDYSKHQICSKKEEFQVPYPR